MSEERNLDDIQAFPILTHPTDATAVRGVGLPGASLSQSVEQQVYGILGWRPRITDPKGLVAALTQSFTSVEKEGRDVWLWTPHTYAVRADLGAVTGAQASIYKRATVIRDESVPLLDGLEPLRADYDLEDAEASRAIVQSSLRELVDELGLVGGPRLQRVDTLFDVLLDVDPGAPTPDEPEQVNGQLGRLRERFGLDRERVNTIEEEQNLTNYLVLVDYVLSLRRSWEAQRHFLDRSGTDVYLGTQLVLISRALATMVESVYEARAAMDSVFLGEVERQTIDLSLEGETTTITIAELLDWVERFGAEEGPGLIREGGKEGVRAARPTIHRLRSLLRTAWELTLESSNPVRGFHTPRVRRTFEELTAYSDKLYDLASQIEETPWIERVDPYQGSPGESMTVNIWGSNFKGKPKKWKKESVSFGEGIDINSVKRRSKKRIKVEISIKGEAEIGFRDVSVTDPDGKSYTKMRAFEVIEPPAAGPAPFEVRVMKAAAAAEQSATRAKKAAKKARVMAEQAAGEAQAVQTTADSAEKARLASEKALTAAKEAEQAALTAAANARKSESAARGVTGKLREEAKKVAGEAKASAAEAKKAAEDAKSSADEAKKAAEDAKSSADEAKKAAAAKASRK